MNNKFSLPGIKRIAYLNAYELPDNLAMHALSGSPVVVAQPLTSIPFTGEVSCTCTRSNAQGASNESVELVFQSLLCLPEDIPLAFLVTDVNDRTYLIGVREQPFPLIESSQGLGSPDGESGTTTYTITHKSPKAMISCVSA